MKRAILAALLLAPVAASAGEVRTASWFADHPDTLRGVLRLCRDNPGTMRRNPNCMNAEQAEGEASYREFMAHGLPNIFGRYRTP